MIKETNPVLYEDLIRRMKRIEGQARGIQRMLNEGEDCEQIIIQLGAMKAAINRVAMKSLACSMGQRMASALESGETTEGIVEDAIEQFIKLG